MKAWIKIALLIALSISYLNADAQREKRQSTRKQMKEQMKSQDSSRSEIEGNYSKDKNKHYEIQDKSTKKRMRANRKRAKKQVKNRSLPFYKRWFRKSHFR